MNEHNHQSNTIKPDELKAFNAVLKQQGCQESDFHVRAVSQEKEEQQPVPKKDAPQQATSQMENHSALNAKKGCKVVVKNDKTGKEKTYQAGESHHWVRDFENDLKNHQFK